MEFINLFILDCILVYIVDISGAIKNLVYPLIKLVLRIPKSKQIEIHLIECSMCLTFWVGMIYSIYVGSFMLFGFGCLLSLLSTNIVELLYSIKDMVGKITYWIFYIFNKS